MSVSDKPKINFDKVKAKVNTFRTSTKQPLNPVNGNLGENKQAPLKFKFSVGGATAQSSIPKTNNHRQFPKMGLNLSKNAAPLNHSRQVDPASGSLRQSDRPVNQTNKNEPKRSIPVRPTTQYKSIIKVISQPKPVPKVSVLPEKPSSAPEPESSSKTNLIITNKTLSAPSSVSQDSNKMSNDVFKKPLTVVREIKTNDTMDDSESEQQLKQPELNSQNASDK